MKMGETRTLATRVSKNFADLIVDFVALDTHLNLSDFLRDAAREKIQRDAPHLYAKLFVRD